MTPRDTALAALTSIIWGLAFVATRFGLESFTATQLTALRFLIAATPVFFVARPNVSWRLLVLIGLTLFAGQFFFLFLAFRAGIPPGLASVTQQSHVFLTVLLATVVFRERPTARQVAGMTLAAAGLVLIALTVGADLPAAALVLALSGALSWAIGNLLLKRVHGVPMLNLVVWCSLVPPVPMLLLSALWQEPSLPTAIVHASWTSLGGALYLGAAATSVYAIWGGLLGRYPAAAVAPLALLSPMTGVAASALVFGERFTASRHSGMVLILTGLAVIVIRPRRRRAGNPVVQGGNKPAGGAFDPPAGQTIPRSQDIIMSDNPLEDSPERDAMIREKAYHLWQAEGCPDGRDGDFWERASELVGMQQSAGSGQLANPMTQDNPMPGVMIEEASIQENLGEFPDRLSDQGEYRQTPMTKEQMRELEKDAAQPGGAPGGLHRET